MKPLGLDPDNTSVKVVQYSARVKSVSQVNLSTFSIRTGSTYEPESFPAAVMKLDGCSFNVFSTGKIMGKGKVPFYCK